MAEAVLNETLLSYIFRRNQINTQIVQYQNRKTLASSETADMAEWKTARYRSARAMGKEIYANKYENTTNSYADYTEIPEYTEEIDYVEAYYESQISDLTAWETNIDNQITTLSTELQEINSYMDSYKSILSENIKNDFNYSEGL